MANPKIGRTQRANAGLQALYQKRLNAMVDEMHRSVEYWIKAQWRSNTPLAMDASAASALRAAIARLTKRWLKNFDEGAANLADYFATGAMNRSDAQLKQTLRDAGFSVQFKFTRNMQQAYTAVIGENVALIKSIPEQYLKSVEQTVMQSVARGRDLGYLSTQLQDTYGVTKRRAALIARDQNNKASAIMSMTRSLDLGITEGIWRHSGAGKHPRPEHVKASGEVFKLAKGMYLEGEWVQPGEAINCRCTYSPVIPGFIA
jgi:SPP1 gp7 family putative phage head morphogenesis protein